MHEERWGTIFHALTELLPLKGVLRKAWSLRKYKAKSAENQREGDQSFDVSVVDEAIRSDVFWCYCHMMDAIGEVLQDVQTWGEACPCHWRGIGAFKGKSRHLRKKEMIKKFGTLCPLRGCQAPACAAGQLRVTLTRFLDASNVCLLAHPSMEPLTQSERSRIMQEFAHARNHLDFCFHTKFGHWQQLPWLLFGLAHWDIREARHELVKHIYIGKKVELNKSFYLYCNL